MSEPDSLARLRAGYAITDQPLEAVADLAESKIGPVEELACFDDLLASLKAAIESQPFKVTAQSVLGR